MRTLLLASSVVAAVAVVSSQVFEVASVKPNKPGVTSVSMRMQPGGRLNLLNVTVLDIIRFAYAVQPFQIDGGPSWLESERYDVLAKVDGEIAPLPPGQIGPVQVMAQNLLAERFKLKAHRQTRDAPAYALVLARDDRKLGKQIAASHVDCVAVLKAMMAGGRAGPPAGPGGAQCRLSTAGPGNVRGTDVSIGQLAQLLSVQLQRQVVDRSGLTGMFSFELSFAADQTNDPDRPSIFTALQEQLGLKLESQRAPLDMVIIDSIEPPTPD